jgi:hypothetical protein
VCWSNYDWFDSTVEEAEKGAAQMTWGFRVGSFSERVLMGLIWCWALTLHRIKCFQNPFKKQTCNGKSDPEALKVHQNTVKATADTIRLNLGSFNGLR